MAFYAFLKAPSDRGKNSEFNELKTIVLASKLRELGVLPWQGTLTVPNKAKKRSKLIS